MDREIERIKIDPTTQIDVDDTDDIEDLRAQLEQMDKEALLQRLNFEETNPQIIKLIKEILKSK